MADSVVSTNTLTITNLEAHHFDPTLLLALRTHTEAFGPVCFFSPIKSFHRVFVVYGSTEHAELAKVKLHNTRFFLDTNAATTLRVYFGQHTELTIDPERYYLHLPSDQKPAADDVSFEKTGLLSPPGSPPIGHVTDEDMEEVEQGFSLDGSSSVPVLSAAIVPIATTVSLDTTTISISDPISTKTQQQHQQIHRLRIDTLLTPSSSSLGSPITPTPTRLAFSPARGSQGEQPFITIQDWGFSDLTSTTQCH
ncbi:carbohydrate-binding module 1 protein [Dissophora globulifera]|uniref:Carbohydrate-binding module 1 protein n=1 Tax=Dissophora globulifera TaxID=979702 RepID=A0A9P6UZL4_9FUNG|nr:carbohydrate-binding module 1 protein [Dissophora globulifera]